MLAEKNQAVDHSSLNTGTGCLHMVRIDSYAFGRVASGHLVASVRFETLCVNVRESQSYDSTMESLLFGASTFLLLMCGIVVCDIQR